MSRGSGGRASTRFGAGVLTWSWQVRVAVTAPFVLLSALLFVQAVLWSQAEDPRAATWFAFLLVPVGGVTWVVVQEVWRSTPEWRRQRHRDRLMTEDLARAQQEPAVNPSIHGPGPQGNQAGTDVVQ